MLMPVFLDVLFAARRMAHGPSEVDMLLLVYPALGVFCDGWNAVEQPSGEDCTTCAVRQEETASRMTSNLP